MQEFHGEELIKFIERFPDDNSCYLYLFEIKWANGYKCKKCGHTHYSNGKKHERTCTLCKHRESTTAGTLFHRLKFGIRKAFLICFELSATTKGMSSSQLSERYGISGKTAWAFSHKVRLAMESRGAFLLKGQSMWTSLFSGAKRTANRGAVMIQKRKKWSVPWNLMADSRSKGFTLRRSKIFLPDRFGGFLRNISAGRPRGSLMSGKATGRSPRIIILNRYPVGKGRILCSCTMWYIRSKAG